MRFFCSDFLYTSGRGEPFLHETQTSTGIIFFLAYFGGGAIKLAITETERPLFMHFLTLRYPDYLMGSYHAFLNNFYQ